LAQDALLGGVVRARQPRGRLPDRVGVLRGPWILALRRPFGRCGKAL